MLKMKKFLASILALAMVLGMTLAVSAEENAVNNIPKVGDVETVTVSNVEAGATVKAYQIVKAEYNENGFVQYVKADNDLAIADVTKPTSTEVADIVENGVTGLTVKEMTTTGTEGLVTYTADLAPGYWIVLVNGAVEIYNPMLVGVYYTVSGSDNTMAAGNVSADDTWTLVTEGAWAKSAKPTIDKSINNSAGNSNGNDVAAGDTINFQIDTVIPSYSAAYKEVIVTITDELSAGLVLNVDSIVITIGGDKFTPAEGKLSSNAAGFTLDLSDVALENSGKAVVITYTATLDVDDFGYNFDANTNTATLNYTNNPTNKDDKEEIKDKTYTYTFGIDANLFGSSTEEWNKVTEEVIKGQLVKSEEESGTVEKFAPLAGAEFALTRADGKVYTAVSDDEGMLNFTGLDAGNYTLVETKAPEGFALNEEKHSVVITADYNENGTLKSYSITIDNEATSTYTATYEGTGTSVSVTEIVDSQATTQILNTKLINLPGTGGIGTTIFTVVGCAVMVGAAFLFFMNRKKEESK